MAQDPVLADQLQIEPGAAGTRLIYRAADGSLAFKDSLLTGGITLSQLAGLRSVANTLVVGKSGAGAAYTTVQAALDAIPASCSLTNPYFVMIMPGIYDETLNIAREAVYLLGMGATLRSLAEATPDGAGAYHTMVIQAALGTIPRLVVLQDLTITNAHANYAGVRIVGAAGSFVGSTGIYFVNTQVQANGLGNYNIWADSVNNVFVQGGGLTTVGLGLSRFENCSRVLLQTPTLTGLSLTYDSTGDEPSEAADSYEVQGGVITSTVATPLTVNLSGGGSFVARGLALEGDTSVLGDRSVDFGSCNLGDITLGGSAAVSLMNSTRGTLTAGGTATLAESSLFGTAAFTAAATQAVLFDAPMPDVSYRVSLELDAAPANDEQAFITAKTVAGFTINFTSVQTLGVAWAALRM
jgi:hypothetical protein